MLFPELLRHEYERVLFRLLIVQSLSLCLLKNQILTHFEDWRLRGLHLLEIHNSGPLLVALSLLFFLFITLLVAGLLDLLFVEHQELAQRALLVLLHAVSFTFFFNSDNDSIRSDFILIYCFPLEIFISLSN